MNQLIKIAAIIVFCSVGAASQGQTPTAIAPQWNELKGEKLQVLQLQGSASRGKEAFQPCQGCHKHDASGTPSGAYPRLAGQHARVLIEQITDIRSGARTNPKMAPFADQHVLTPQEIADIAIYLQALPIRFHDSGKGSGQALGLGQSLYTKDCATCHGDRGQGNAEKFIPLVAGQHYRYVAREIEMIRDHQRGNANPDMVQAVRTYRDSDIEAVSDFISRLVIP